MTPRYPPFLPYGRHLVDEDDVAAVAEALRGDWLTTGPRIEQLEVSFADCVGAPHATVCSSGTAALHLACTALGLGPGDAVVVPAITFLATANAARFCGADVVFADVNPETGVMTAETLRQAVKQSSDWTLRAALPVHLAGHCHAPEAIASVAAEYGLAIVEDACHALGGSYLARDGSMRPVGSCHHATMSCFSLHPVKAIAMGEGGVVTTKNAKLNERLSRLRNHGIVRDPNAFQNPELGRDASGTPDPWYYEMPELGFNYRASEMQCALGLSQLAKLDRFIARRRALAALYDERLRDLAPLVRPLRPEAGCESGRHLYVVLIDFDAIGNTRAALMRQLSDRGIGTQVHYIPLHKQPYYRRLYGEQQLPGAERYYARTLSLPLHVAMNEDDVARVVETLSELLR